MKSYRTPMLVLGLLALAALFVRGPQLASADPGSGGTKYDASVRSYPATCKTTKNTRTMIGSTAAACTPSPLANRNVLQICNSFETFVFTDAGVGSSLKVRTDGTAPAFGATTPGWVLPVATLAGTPSCTPPLTQGANDGGQPLCIAQYGLTDAGGSVAVDIFECAY